MSMRSVDDDDIHAGFNQETDALLRAFADPDRRTHTQAPELILAGKRVFGGLQNVLDGDQAAQFEIFIHDQHPFQPVLVQQAHRFLDADPFLHGHQPVARRHDVLHGLIEIAFETQIAVGHDADHFRPIDDRASPEMRC